MQNVDSQETEREQISNWSVLHRPDSSLCPPLGRAAACGLSGWVQSTGWTPGWGEGRNGATSAKAMKDLAEVQGVLSFGVAGDKPGIKGMPGMGRRCFYQKTCGMK